MSSWRESFNFGNLSERIASYSDIQRTSQLFKVHYSVISTVSVSEGFLNVLPTTTYLNITNIIQSEGYIRRLLRLYGMK